MDQLFTPHAGLMIWTVVTFCLLLGVMVTFGWKPLLKALEEREARVRGDIQSAEDNRRAAEVLKKQHESQLRAAEGQIQTLLDEAKRSAEAAKTELLRLAQDEAEKLLEKSRQQLAEEREKLIDELRQDVVQVSVKMTEKLLRQNVDAALHESLTRDILRDWGKTKN